MAIQTTVSSKFQTTIPANLREEFNIKPADKLEWKSKGDYIIVKKIESLSFEDMKGRYQSKEPFDSVELKKKVEREEKI